MSEDSAAVSYALDEPESHETSSMAEGLRLVAKLVRPHKFSLAISLVGSAVFALATVISAAVLGWVTDDVIIATFNGDQPDAGTVAAKASAAVAAVAVLRIGGVIARRYFAGMTSELAQFDVRSKLADRYVDSPLSWLRRHPTGRLLAHVESDARVLVESLGPMPFAFGVLCLGVFSGARLLMVDVWFALVALVVFPLMWTINSVYARAVSGPIARVQDQLAAVTGLAHESFEGAIIVKTLGRHGPEVARMDGAARELEDRRRHAGNIKVAVDAVLGLVPPFGILTVVVLGAYRVQAGDLGAGAVIEVATLFSALAIPMLVFGFLLESMIPSVVAWKRLQPVLEADVGDPDGTDLQTASLPDGPLSVSFANVSFGYPDAPDQTVLDDVSFSVAPGEMVAIVGATGSGKSTLVDALTGSISVDGSVRLADVSVAKIAGEARSDSVAHVFQEAFLFADTIRANIDLEGVFEPADVVAAAQAAAIHDFIVGLPAGYDTILGERGVTVSGGQRQRIALARALIRNAGLVILDDATSALDPVVERNILEHLRSSVDATLVVIANRLATISLSDRVVHLVDGRVAAIGPHDELLKNPSYRELVMAYGEASDV